MIFKVIFDENTRKWKTFVLRLQMICTDFLLESCQKNTVLNFAADMEDTYFEVLFPYESPIRELNDQKIERMMFHVCSVWRYYMYRRRKWNLKLTELLFPSLGYEHGERIFSTKESVLDECIRFQFLHSHNQLVNV